MTYQVRSPKKDILKIFWKLLFFLKNHLKNLFNKINLQIRVLHININKIKNFNKQVNKKFFRRFFKINNKLNQEKIFFITKIIQFKTLK